ncbi:unnamed protein product [Triticum turgidum subsp. durum]|uniref:Protein NBR1 homolog n=2 Tax=Triticum TaxID=4564 RepID=A0A9R0Y148_TRITD|nr:unnamed protein product [Triticum turgidum subsp. durum]
MSGLSAPPFDGLASGPDPWDVVVKVKYGDTLKRFNGYVNGTHFTLNLSALRSKIASAFKFAPDADFILTYTDEDGDVVMLDDDEDLHDAAIHQKLNPLRINVQLKNSHAGASHINRQDSSPKPLEATTQDPIAQIKSVIDEALKPISEPLRSTAREDPLAHLKSALDEAMKSIHEPVPESLAKLSREVLDAAPPQLTDLIKPFVNLITSTNSSQSAGHAESSPGSSRGVQQARVDLKADGQPKVEASLGSRPLNERNPVSSETGGLKSVLVEVPAAVITEASQGHQGSLYPSVEDLLYTSNSGGNSSGCKDMTDAQSKGKSVMPSAEPLARNTVPSFRPSHPNASGNEWFQTRRSVDGWSQPRSIWQPETNVKPASDPGWRVPMYKAPHPSPPVPHAPLGYGHSPQFPYPGRLLSAGRLYGNLGNNSERSPRISHRWIQCDGCGVQPIVGPRYKSNVKEDYDLCDTCFCRMGSEVEYTRIDKPILPHKLSRDPNLIPLNGFPVDQEMDVAVDFVAPARPGRYISYWRLASPSGQKFGQRVWVHIQVEDPSFVSDNKTAAVNLNQPQESNITNTSSLPQESNMTNTSNLIDVNMEPANQVLDEHVNGTRMELLEPSIYREAAEPKKSPSAFSAAPPYPMVDVPSSSENAAAFVPSVTVLAPEVIPRPAVTTPADVPTSSLTSIPVDLPVAATTPVDVASAPLDIDSLTEEKLLQELEEMGFKQVDLNKEILRQNKYNLEQSVDDLCGVNEWDPLLAELNEMGFDDRETNKELLAKNGGSIKRAVMDLIAREKKDK